MIDNKYVMVKISLVEILYAYMYNLVCSNRQRFPNSKKNI